MKAQVGDWVVVEGVSLGVPTRRGQVVELRHPDGSPPYLVHWLDTGRRTLVFPGPDARVVPAEDEARRFAAPADTGTVHGESAPATRARPRIPGVA